MQLCQCCRCDLHGAPLSPGNVFDDTWLARCEDLKLAVERLSLLSAQDALLLLRVSFSDPRVQHLLRYAPSVDNPVVDLFDGYLRSAVNTNISDNTMVAACMPVCRLNTAVWGQTDAFAGTSCLFGCEHLGPSVADLKSF